MFAIPSSKTTEVTELPLNMPAADVTVFGIMTFVRDLHPLKMYEPIFWTFPRSIDVSFEQSENAQLPIFVTLVGITISVSCPQFPNAPSPISVTFEPMMIVVSLEQLLNAYEEIFVRLSGKSIVVIPVLLNA